MSTPKTFDGVDYVAMEDDYAGGGRTSQTHKTEAQVEASGKRNKCIARVAVVVILFTIACLVFVFRRPVATIAQNFLRWLQNNIAVGSLAFALVYVVATVAFIPGLILTIGAGFVFTQALNSVPLGLLAGTLVVWVGAATGATIAFLVGRFILRDTIDAWAKKYPTFGIIDRVVEEKGFRVTFLLRLSPLIPFNAFNYLMGGTAVNIRDYVLAHFGMLPGTFAYVFVGVSIGNIANAANSGGIGGNPLLLGLTIGGSVLALVGVVYVSWVAKREFNRIAQADAGFGGRYDSAGKFLNDDEEVNLRYRNSMDEI